MGENHSTWDYHVHTNFKPSTKSPLAKPQQNKFLDLSSFDIAHNSHLSLIGNTHYSSRTSKTIEQVESGQETID